MTTYQDDRKKKLSTYKTTYLTPDKGYWRDGEYDHILPTDQKEKNIFESIRNDFWTYYNGADIKLHQYFHHLNSSQALCFNLFFPLLQKDKRFLTYVLHRIIEVTPTYRTPKEKLDKLFSINNDLFSDQYAMELEEEFLTQNSFISCEFEKILDNSEATNFDFYVELQGGRKTLFEIKYTENEFGKADNDDRHKSKFKNIYRPKLDKILRPEFISEDFVFDNYQIIRNLSYIDDLTTVIFLFPQANKKLTGTADLISQILLPDILQQVRVVYLEDFVRLLLDKKYLTRLRPTFETFKQKYIE